MFCFGEMMLQGFISRASGSARWYLLSHSVVSVASAGFSTLLLWAASLVSFAFSTMAAQCESEYLTFSVAGFALAIGSLGAGLFSDRLGRLRTVRYLFATGTVVSAVAALLAPSDVTVLLVLTALAGAAAGGSHVSAELFLEAVPAQFRAFALLCFPALFLPAGAVQAGLRSLGWTGSAILTAALCAGAGLVLRGSFPESVGLESIVRHRLDRSRIVATAADGHSGAGSSRGPPMAIGGVTQRRAFDAGLNGFSVSAEDEGDDDADALGSANSSASPLRAAEAHGADLHPYAVASTFGDEDTSLGISSPIWMRLMIVTTILWLLFISVYWVSASALIALAGGDLYDGAAARTVAAFCGHSPQTADVIAAAAAAALAANNKLHCGSVGDSSGGASSFMGSAHLLLAEIVAIVGVALFANSPQCGRKFTLAGAFGLAAALSAVAVSVSLSSPACSGAAGTGALMLEFSLRATIAAAGQALFLYTLETTATTQRSTAAGLALGAFRLGAFLSLAGDPGTAPSGRLQWSAYALRTEAGFLGLPRGSAEHATAVAAALAACAQACLVAACLCICLPIDTQLKELRPGAYDSFTDVDSSTPRPLSSSVSTASSARGDDASPSSAGSRRARGIANAARGNTWEPASTLSPSRPINFDRPRGPRRVVLSALAGAPSPMSSFFNSARAVCGAVGSTRGGYTPLSQSGQGRDRLRVFGHGGRALSVRRAPEPPLHVSAATLARACEAFERQVVPRALRNTSTPIPMPLLQPPETLGVAESAAALGAGVGLDSVSLDEASAEGTIAFFMGQVSAIISRRDVKAAHALAEKIEDSASRILYQRSSTTMKPSIQRAAQKLDETAHRLNVLAKIWALATDSSSYAWGQGGGPGQQEDDVGLGSTPHVAEG
jgi:hypothetical protein